MLNYPYEGQLTQNKKIICPQNKKTPWTFSNFSFLHILRLIKAVFLLYVELPLWGSAYTEQKNYLSTKQKDAMNIFKFFLSSHFAFNKSGVLTLCWTTLMRVSLHRTKKLGTFLHAVQMKGASSIRFLSKEKYVCSFTHKTCPPASLLSCLQLITFHPLRRTIHLGFNGLKQN